jgi:hypothetical protein
VSDRVLALAEITELERAYALGAPTLGRAAAALLARWRLPLRDEETFLRLAFLVWYRENEPAWLTGLDAELPSLAQLVTERGGADALSAEALFTLGLLLEFRPPLGADEDAARRQARAWLAQASAREPASRLFGEWRYLVGDTDGLVGARVYAEAEVHARYAGRGELGAYLVHTLRTRLRPEGPAPATT